MELKQFKITVVPLRDKLLNYARRMTDDPSDAEDAVQEVMLKLWNLRQKLDELAMYLYEKETITGEEFMNILNGGKTDNTDKNKLEVNAADEDRKEAEQNEQKN